MSIRPHPQAGYTGFEPVISSVTGKRELQASPIPRMAAAAGLEPAKTGLRTQALDALHSPPKYGAVPENRTRTLTCIRRVLYRLS